MKRILLVLIFLTLLTPHLRATAGVPVVRPRAELYGPVIEPQTLSRGSVSGSLTMGSGGANDQIVQGFGANTTGGAGGTSLVVTGTTDVDDSTAVTADQLAADDGADNVLSFREACLATGPRIITFATSGWITLTAALTIEASDVTIDGSTAPNGGIGIKGHSFSLGNNGNGDNLILKYVRVRPGSAAPSPGSTDGFSLGNGVENVVIDHCDLGWAADECFGSSSSAKNVTVQWSILHEGLDFTAHPDGGSHSKGSLVYRNADEAGDGGWTFHHNLLINNTDRHPEVGEGVLLEFVNNICYNGFLWANFFTAKPLAVLNANIDINDVMTGSGVITVSSGGGWGTTAGWNATGSLIIDDEQFTYTGWTTSPDTFTGVTRATSGTSATTHNGAKTIRGLNHPARVHADFIGNYYIEGPNSDAVVAPRKEFERSDGFWTGGGTDEAIYVSGNLGQNRPTLADPESAMLSTDAAAERTLTPHVVPPKVSATSAAQAKIDVLAKAGCRLPYRDAVTQRLLAEVTEGRGIHIDHEEEAGGYPDLTLSSNTRQLSVPFIANNRRESESENLTTITTESAHTWAKTTGYTGDIILDGGRRAFSAGTSLYEASWVPTGADYYVKATTTQLSSLGRAGVAGRISGAANNFYAAIRTTSGIELIKVVAGVETSLGTFVPSGDVNATSLKLKMVGSTIQAWCHGASRISVTDTSITAKGLAGPYIDGGGSASTGFHLSKISAREY